MNFNMNKIIFTLISIAIATACTTNKETIVISPAPPSQSTQLPNPGMGGTDSAGGNGFDGKPLESYAVNIVNKSEFAKLKSLIANVAKISPRYAARMLYIAKEKRWYFLSTELKKIPSSLVGSALESTEQIALQTRGEVWINMIIYGKMDSNDQSLLLLHELVMGTRIMEFQDRLDDCLATAEEYNIGILNDQRSEKDEKSYKNARMTCYLEFGGFGHAADPILQQSLSLEKSDYMNVRYLVTELWNSQGKVNDELEPWLKVKKFLKTP